MANRSGENDTLAASFGPGLSAGLSSARERNSEPTFIGRITWAVPVEGIKRRDQPFPFLALPTEIRLQIYHFALADRRPILISNLRTFRRYEEGKPTPKTAILRTSKLVYGEALPILYSSNTLRVLSAEEMLEFIKHIGPTKIGFVRSLEIWVLWRIDIFPWLTLLDILAKKATGLRVVRLHCQAKLEVFDRRGNPRPILTGAVQREAANWGQGDSTLFVHALAKIGVLETLTISGPYPENWPSYLKENMKVRVLREESDHPLSARPAIDGEMIPWEYVFGRSRL